MRSIFKIFYAFLIVLIATINAMAQSGPGGLGDNSGSSNLVFWLKADADVLNAGATAASDGEAVSAWLDQSGYGYHAATGATSPIFTSSNLNFGNSPTITFAGGATEFLFVEDDADEAPQLDGTDEISIIYVYNPANLTSVRGHVSKRDGNGVNQSYVSFTNGGTQNSRINSNNDGGSSATIGNTFINAITYTSSAFEHFLNQSFTGGTTGTGASIANNDSDLHIGTLDAGDARNFIGDFAEVIIFREHLTNAQRIVVESYLASKYDITLTDDFWDETTYSAYDNEIAGIGQHTDGSIANSATSGALTISGGLTRGNGDWMFIGHDNGDFTTYTSTEIIIGSGRQRLEREWVVNETNDLGAVNVSIATSAVPASGLANPNYFLLVDSDGDADFSNATAFPMTLSGSSYTAEVDLAEGDHLALSVAAGDDTEIWYSYLTGNWNNPANWTLDGALSASFVNPDNKVPGVGDSVVIQSGRTITVDINDIVIQRIEIIGTLDLSGSSGHNFGNIEGIGTMRLSGSGGLDNYPAGNDSPFFDADEGGTVEYYGAAIELNQIGEFNNLIINLDNSSDVATYTASSFQINGDLNISRGVFQFNDGVSTDNLNVTVDGNVNVLSNGGIAVSTANARHEFNLNGNFTNQGIVNFTNRVSQSTGSEATDGIVDVNFVSPSSDQIVDLQNITNFYRIEINKGVDDTYVVEISADDPSFFNLFGFANGSTGGAQETTNSNALGLVFGTVKVGNNITISPLNAGGNYNIYEGAQLWVDGGTVEKTGGTAIVPYGEIRVSAGFLNAPINSGITTRDNGQLTIEGGTVTVNQFRTSINGVSAQGGLIMSGGIFNIIGGSTSTNYYTFSLTYSGNVFNMSGGTINMSGSNSVGAIYINSSDENINVTGGTINFDVTNINNMVITSRAPFFNVNMLNSSSSGNIIIDSGSSGTGAGQTSLTPDGLTVLNDLRIDNTAGNGTTFNANGFDVNITGSLTIDNGSNVDLTGMELTFDDNGSSSFDIQTGATIALDTLIIDKASDLSSVLIVNGASTALVIDDLLNVKNGNFDIAGFDVTLNGDLSIADTIGTATSTGQLLLNGGAAQSITSNSGLVYDMEIDNTNGVSLDGDLAISDNFALNSGIFNIGTHKLTLAAQPTTTGAFGTSLMIQTAGNASDGGIEYYFDGTTANPSSILYPVGTGAKYTPAQLDLVDVTDDGYVQINPVDSELNTTDLTAGNALDYYWRVRNREYSALPNVTLLTFDADPADLSGTVNHALGKSTSQSSTDFGGLSSFAVDGNTDGNFGSTSTTHTALESEASWTVDMGEVVDITSINIYNRTDCCSNRLQNYHVFVSDNPFTGTSVAESQSQLGVTEFFEATEAGSPTTITPGSALTGRYVRVQLAGTNPLSLAEVEVLGPFSFVPGGVEDGVDSNDTPATDTSFDRFYETNGFSSPTISFDGEFSDGAQQPFQLRTANYTAGDIDRFVGAPLVYYSKDSPVDGGFNFLFQWDNAASWVRSDQLTDLNGDLVIDELDWHRGDNPNSPDFPGAGDIAVIGYIPPEDPNITNRGLAHHLNIQNEVEECAELIFTQMKDAAGNPVPRTDIFFALRPSVLITGGSGQLNADVVKGEGEFFIRFGGDPDFSVMDLGDFVEQDSSLVFYEAASNRVYNNAPVEVPNLILGTSNFGLNNFDIQFSTDIAINQNLELLGNVNLVLDNGAGGDLNVSRDILMFETQSVPLPCCGGSSPPSGGGAEIAFPNSGNSRTLTVDGDIRFENEGAEISVRNPGTTPLEHTITLGGNVVQNTTTGGGLVLFTDAAEDRITFNLVGEGSHSYNLTSGSDPAFYRIVLNKGADTTNVFTFNSNFTLGGDNTTAPQALELQNGKLILNDASLNIELTNGADYSIPSGTGLEVTQGTVTTTSANVILNGLLKVNGGTVDLGTTDIEYSNTGSALIEVNSGTLEVGGQVRRATTTTTGVLKYRQTGGDVDIAVDQANVTTRASFEVLNAGSEFTLTGGTFNIDRGVTGDANTSLELDPETFDVTGSTITLFENLSADYGSNFFNITSSIALNDLLIANSIDLPDVRLFVQPLTVNNLTINNSQTFDANALDLTLTGNLLNNGTYLNNSSITTFSGDGAQSISGSGSFTLFNLTKNGLGITTSSVDLSLGNDLRVEAGILDIGSNTISLQNDAYIESTLTNSSGNGLVFNGTSGQDLYGLANNTVTLGTVTISNPTGVDIPDGNGYNFDITQELRLNGGVFNIGGSLVSMKRGSTVTEASTFNENNMVQTNSSFTDNGFVIEFFDVAADTIIFFPVGELTYTPVQFDISSGATTGSIRVRPANERHPGIIDNVEPLDAPNTEIDDLLHSLQYYWVVVAEGVTNVLGEATFFYDQDDIIDPPADTANFISGRLLSNGTNWDKFPPTFFDGSTQSFSVPLDIGSGVTFEEITGDYTAGLGSSNGVDNDIEGALPDELAQYVSNVTGSGNYSEDANWTEIGTSPELTSGIGPVGAQITISNGDVITLDISNIRLFSTNIEEGGTLIVPAGVTNVRLGTVTGSGTIVLTDTELLPVGEFSDFLACDGGALEYNGSTNFSVLSGISQIRKVTLSGTGVRTMPNNALNVCDTLIINGPTVAFNSGNSFIIGDADTDRMEIQSGTVSLANSTDVVINGDFILSGGSFTGSGGTSLAITDDINYGGGTLDINNTDILLNGTTQQLIDGNFTGASSLQNLTINNSSSEGIRVNSGGVEIDGLLTLTDGLVSTSTSRTLTLTATGDWTDASTASYVTGPITKNDIAIASTYEFPVGKAERYAPGFVANIGTGGQNWTAEYFTSTGAFNESSFDTSDPGSGFNALSDVISQDRWEITSSGSNSAQIRLTYGTHHTIADINDLRVVWWNTAQNRWENQGGTVTGNASGGTIISENSIGFSTQQFGLGQAPEIALPVEMIYFTASLDDDDAVLEWATASELNNDRFEVERSLDGVNFELIGEVTGNGTTDIQQNYQYIDIAPRQGLNYYRLKQVDFDGAFEYSEIVFVDFTDREVQFKAIAYPNPTSKDEINIRLSTGDELAPVDIQIIDFNGRVFYSNQIIPDELSNNYRLNINEELASGVYLVLIRQREQTQQIRLMIR